MDETLLELKRRLQTKLQTENQIIAIQRSADFVLLDWERFLSGRLLMQTLLDSGYLIFIGTLAEIGVEDAR